MRLPLLAAAAIALASTAVAQSSLLFTIDESSGRPVIGPAALHQEAGKLDEHEIGLVTPLPGVSYGAEPFLSSSMQWAFVGDHDGDGDFFENDDGPGSDIDAIMVNRLLAAPVDGYRPRDVFISKASDLAPLFLESDIFRYSGQGDVEIFLYESTVAIAIGQTPGDSIDIDAVCNDPAGNLYFSFNSTEDINGTSALDGAIIYVSIADITLDGNLNIAAITPGSAVIAATEADVRAWIMNSGVMDAQGTTPPTSPGDVELSALDVDPNGGTFVSSQDAGLVLPNLIFSWDDTETDGAILSTASGGSIATLNGASLASSVATTGTQLGLLPGSSGTDGVWGLAVIPFQSGPMLVESAPEISYGGSSPEVTRQELVGATPGGQVAFFMAFAGATTFSAIDLAPLFPGFISGELFGINTMQVAVRTADEFGLAAYELILPSGWNGSGLKLVWQAADATTLRFSWPGATDF